MQVEAAKTRAAVLSLGYNFVFTVVKLAAAVTTGSVSLLSEAAHSATDIVASAISLVSVRAAAAPPDDEHPYGHGKIEALAGFGESLLLLAVIGFVVSEAVIKLLSGARPAHLDFGLWVMGLSAVTSLAVGLYVARIGNSTQSLALISNGQHLLLDCWTSVGVLVALAMTRFTGWAWTDSAAALALAGWLGLGAARMIPKAFNELIDMRLPDEEIAKIEAVLCAEPELLGFHRLRTRHSGRTHYIDVHIVVPTDWSVVRAHGLADSLEKRIAEALPPACVVIHVDPFDAAKARKIT